MNKIYIATGLLIVFIILAFIKAMNIFNVVPAIYFNAITILCTLYLIVAVFFIKTFQEREMFQELIIKQNEHADNLNSFIRVLRTERHDFMNHFTVLGGLLSLEKPDMASQYLKEVLNQSKINTKIMVLKQPVLIALLNGKLAQANQKEIDFLFDINSNLENLSINPTDITAIFGNLIDNAIEAAIIEKNDKFVSFITSEDPFTYTITVINSGPAIPEDIETRIFSPGFSTKGLGRGFGLSIVLSTVEKYGGVISMTPNPTAFNVTIPKVINND